MCIILLLILCIVFLLNRFQRVKIENVLSEPTLMGSGVPQGSVLGPLLFLIYINDLSDSIPQNIDSKLFADDAKLYSEIKCIEDIDTFQEALDSLAEWAQAWQLPISVSKCFSLNLCNSDEYYNNNVNGFEVKNTCDIRDLGVLIDEHLSFTKHISCITSKAKLRISQLFRCFRTDKVKDLLHGYNSYILPIVTYCSPVWSPHCKNDITSLESVQKYFTKNILQCKFLPYLERLAYLQIPSLEKRRLWADLIMCRNIETQLEI